MPVMPMHSAALRQCPSLPGTIPWGWLEPHRKQAESNHYQTLERLAERGGICAKEALAIIKECDFHQLGSYTQSEAWDEIKKLKEPK